MRKEDNWLSVDKHGRGSKTLSAATHRNKNSLSDLGKNSTCSDGLCI